MTTETRVAIGMRIARDHVYIDALAFDTHLAGVASFALRRDNDDLWILPIVHVEAGGYFVKRVNAHGDRAIHAADFFRSHGIDEARDLRVEAVWTDHVGGFVVCDFFAPATDVCAARK